MRKLSKTLALPLAAVICAASFSGCYGNAEEKALNVGFFAFSEVFSPFFAETASDQDVAGLTQLPLLTFDREGAVVEKGIDGVTDRVGERDYVCHGPANVEIVMGADGTTDYKFTLRDDIKFSDGKKLTADDVIFSMYVLSDPAYDGLSPFFTLPIKGMKEYRGGWDALNRLIFGAGRENTDFGLWSEEKQSAFWRGYNHAVAKLAESAASYCAENEYADEGDIIGSADVFGFEIEENTVECFAKALSETYGADLEYMVSDIECGAHISELFPDYYDYTVYIQNGESADRISGIVKNGDYSLTVTATHFSVNTAYRLAVDIAPLHYYGDKKNYNYEDGRFGFEKGDLCGVKSKNSKPVGAGAYKFIKLENHAVSLEANKSYYLGRPKTKYVTISEYNTDFDKLKAIINGHIDIADFSFSAGIANAVRKADAGNGLLHAETFDNLGYGYIGLSAKNVCVGGNPASEASKNLRKAFAVVFSFFRAPSVAAYYGREAEVVDYPVSNACRAAPKKGERAYKSAFCEDVGGNPIYADIMDEEGLREAVKEASLGFFRAAGYTVSGGKVKAAPAGAQLDYTAFVPAAGKGSHPCFKLLENAGALLAEIGVNLKINDLEDFLGLWNGLNEGTVDIWTAAWNSTAEPDLYSAYFSGAEGLPDGNYNYMYSICDEKLNGLILKAAAENDDERRKEFYRDCFDIVMDWAIEVPVYQYKNAVIFSGERVDSDSVERDFTAFHGWMNEIHNIALK